MNKIKIKSCDTCNDAKYITASDEQGIPEIQKCDECNYFKSDKQAQLYHAIYKMSTDLTN
jgi:hypothetical protein